MLLAVQQRDLQRRPRLPHPPVLVYLRRGNLLYLRPQTLPVYEVRFYAAAPALLGCSALLTIIIIIAVSLGLPPVDLHTHPSTLEHQLWGWKVQQHGRRHGRVNMRRVSLRTALLATSVVLPVSNACL